MSERTSLMACHRPMILLADMECVTSDTGRDMAVGL